MKQRLFILPIAVILLCMLTACGDDTNRTLPESIPQADTDSRNSEETADASLTQPIPSEETEDISLTQSIPSEETEDISLTQPIPPEGTGEEIEDAEVSAAEQKPTPAPKPEEIQITISAAGDASLGNYYGQGYSGSFRETYDRLQDYNYFFENVYDIFSADDMTIVNLEGMLTHAQERREEQEYCISGDPEFVNILTAGSVEAVSMGNNHRPDYLQQGSDDTVKVLEETGIPYAYDQYTGIYETPQGVQIGFVSVCVTREEPTGEKYLEEGITRLREAGCDLVFACCHWGIEREYHPNDFQKDLGRKCIDWGADLVIGHHPHVIQGIEEYRGKYIVYSLGNFCFGANRNPKDKDCLIVQQTFTFIDGALQDETVLKVIPCSVSSVSDRNDYKPTPAEGKAAGRILDKLNQSSLEFGLQFDQDGYPYKN